MYEWETEDTASPTNSWTNSLNCKLMNVCKLNF